MKQDTFEHSLLKMLIQPPMNDIDSVSRAGPVIAMHLNAVLALCNTIPNSENLKQQVEDLKALFATYIPMQDNVLEKDLVSESVIYRLDHDDPMNASEILILGGAGRYSMAGLRRKAQKESEQLAKDLQGEHVDYRGAAHNVKQVANTINTMVAALNELNALKSRDGARSRNEITTEQHLQNPVHPSVSKLEKNLKQAAKGGKKLSYGQIDNMMKQISSEDGVSTTDLHNMWVSSHGGWTPDQWVDQSPAITDKGVHEDIKDMNQIIGMFDSLTRKMSESAAWVHIAKRLAKTHDSRHQIDEMINQAILTVHKRNVS